MTLLQFVAAWRARSPAATPPVNRMDLSLVTDASLQTPPDDNLLMHTYQDRTSSRWDRQPVSYTHLTLPTSDLV